MARTAYLRTPLESWRAIEFGTHRHVWVFDPNEPKLGLPGCVWDLTEGRPKRPAFYGSRDARRNPYQWRRALDSWLLAAPGDLHVILPALSESPLVADLLHDALDRIAPDRLVTGEDPWYRPVRSVEVVRTHLEPALSEIPERNLRRGQWLDFQAQTQLREFDLKTLRFAGARIGSGHPLDFRTKRDLGMKNILHAERIGKTLYLVTRDEPEPDVIPRALDHLHLETFYRVDPGTFERLFVGMFDEHGHQIGMGLIDHIHWLDEVLSVHTTAIPPAVPYVVRLGGLRIGPTGDEFEDLRPWQI